MPKLPRLRARGRRFYYDHGGKPRRWEPLGSDEATALRRYYEIERAGKPNAGSVDAMLADCITAAKVADGTRRNYQTYRKHLGAVFRDPLAVTQADVLRYLRICPRMTFRSEIALLSQAYVGWMDKGLLDFNPCFGVKIKRKGSQRTRLLSDAEIAAILDKADERLAVAIELAYATGLRIGDICRLRWADLEGTFRTQKTHHRATIEDAEALAPILARAKALQARVASLYVICGRGAKQWTPDALRDQWAKAREAAGVEDARFHDLRAAAATEIERTQGAEAARQFLTHRNIQTTMLYLRDRRATVIRPLRRKA